jgi:pimeloyl-ACP methyl ester carboxylesterase
LSRQFRIIVPDLPGHGRSAGEPLGSAEAYAGWLEEFCQALRLHNFILMGHSFGGAVVQEYARCHPHKVSGMVLVGTGTGFRLSRIYRELCESGMPAGADGMAADARLPEPFRKGYVMLLSQGSRSLHADLLAAARFDSSAWVGSLRMPALVMWGSRDEITPAALPEELARMLPQGRLQVIEGAGHVLMIDARDEFNRVVTAFMEQTIAAENRNTEVGHHAQ